MATSSTNVAVIGAGPYGLSAAAHLRSANVDTHVFGDAMEFWRCQMPAGMFLRSSWDASHIAHPDRALTLNEYQAKHGIHLPVPVPLDKFIEYGQWFQGQVAPDPGKPPGHRQPGPSDGRRRGGIESCHEQMHGDLDVPFAKQ